MFFFAVEKYYFQLGCPTTEWRQTRALLKGWGGTFVLPWLMMLATRHVTPRPVLDSVERASQGWEGDLFPLFQGRNLRITWHFLLCLLYTSDAADE